MWSATVLTLFPEMFPGPLGFSLSGKALDDNLWSLSTINMRDFAVDKHQTVDDTPFGGGAGMVIRPDVVDAALNDALAQTPHLNRQIIFLTPRGAPLQQHTVRNLMQCSPDGVILLCGRYEGIDNRVIEKWRANHNLIEISIGDYVLSGGEMAALTFMDACVRLIPGVVNTTASLDSESFEIDLLEFSHYTRPKVWDGVSVPDVLLSGHHKKIDDFRHAESLEITKNRRPDIYDVYHKKNKS
jgi:tRNA (guanine37-N1)-methyltransferase